MPPITRAMYHKDLQPSYRLGRIVTCIARRNWGLRMMDRFAMKPMAGNKIEGMFNDEIYIPSSTTPGHKIRARVFKPAYSKGPLPVMIYAHGGGYQVGVPEIANDFFKDLIERRDIAIIAPAYRLSLQGHPYPHGLNDCFDTLMYAKANAAQLGIRADKFITAGHSGGGGMTAALTMKTLDEQAADIAFQMPVYPMLDHRMQTKSAREMIGTMIWDRRTNALAWNNYLGHLEGNVPDHASPSLRDDLTGHPPTISFVGDLEPFKDETIAYIQTLNRAGIPTKFKLYEGCFHGFELLDPKVPIAKDANAFQIDAFAEYFDRYL